MGSPFVYNEEKQKGRDANMAKKQRAGRDRLGALAFYCGWPKAWSAFWLIQEVYGEE